MSLGGVSCAVAVAVHAAPGPSRRPRRPPQRRHRPRRTSYIRHTNATLALEAGVDLKVVSERLGHATTAITADIYTHVAPSVGRAATERIASLLKVDA